MPRGPEIPLTIRHVAIAYFFDLEMRQTDICDRLGISKQSLSVLISRTRERCPSYVDPEKAGPTPEELNMLCAAAAVKPRAGRPRRADGGGRCSHCGAPRLRTKKAKKAAAEFAAKLEAAKKAGEPAPERPADMDVGGDDEDDGEGSDDGDHHAGDEASTSAQAPPPPAPADDDTVRAASGGGGMYLPPITTPAPSSSTAPPPAPSPYPTAASPYPPGPMAVPGVSMVNGIVSQGGGSWFYGNNGWEMYGRRDVGDNTQVPSSHGGDYNRQY
jgi:hypothetical protein